MSEQSTAIPKAQSQFGAVWQQFRVHRGAVFGLIVLGLLAAFVIFGPLFWPEVKLKVVEALKVKNQGPSLRFPFGTDQLGRDMMVRMMAAGKVSLAVGFVAMIIAIFVGTGIGILAGYFKRLDGPLMRMTDLFLSLPLIPLLLVLVMLFRDTIASVLGPELGAFLLIVFAIGITSWMQAADCAGRGFGPERARVCVGRQINRRARAACDLAPYPAQHHLAGHGRCDLGGGRGHHYGIRPVVPWPWLSARFPNMGAAVVRWVAVYSAVSRTGDLARPCDFAHCLVGQLHR